MKTSRFVRSKIILIVVSLCIFSGCTSVSKSNTNLDPKSKDESASGGFVWGQNDPKTGLPEEELTDEEILKRQDEVLKRQEIEKKRLEKEKEDILRQEYYNRQLKNL